MATVRIYSRFMSGVAGIAVAITPIAKPFGRLPMASTFIAGVLPGANRAGVESVMNHRHLMDLFSHAAGTVVTEPSCEQLEYLGCVLRDAWETKLSRDFPGRQFTVSFDRGAPDDLLGYIVTFWQPVNRPGG